MTPSQLPPPEKHQLKLGYMRLSDSAPLIHALESGLYDKYGLEVALQREVSWANLRDRLVLGDLDAAQLLSPLPMMTSYGAGGLRADLLTGLVLNLNGNALTVASSLAARLQDPGENPGPLELARRLSTMLNSGALNGLTFATVHLFSMHTLQLRLWLQAGGIDPDQDVKIIVLPPEQMCDSLARGIIDGYCVGEPWNSVAVQRGVGSILATGYDLWQNAPEKVLGVTQPWHQRHPGTHLRLRLALMEACRDLVSPATREALAPVMAQAQYLDLPVANLLPALTGKLQFSKAADAVTVPDFLVFSRFQAGFPWRSTARRVLGACNFALGAPIPDDEAIALVQKCYRTDLFREAARHLGISAPSKDSRPEGSHDSHWTFEPDIELGPDRALQQDPGPIAGQ